MVALVAHWRVPAGETGGGPWHWVWPLEAVLAVACGLGSPAGHPCLQAGGLGTWGLLCWRPPSVPVVPRLPSWHPRAYRPEAWGTWCRLCCLQPRLRQAQASGLAAEAVGWRPYGCLASAWAAPAGTPCLQAGGLGTWGLLWLPQPGLGRHRPEAWPAVAG